MYYPIPAENLNWTAKNPTAREYALAQTLEQQMREKFRINLFSGECKTAQAETLWQQSIYSENQPEEYSFHTPEEIQHHVIVSMKTGALLLSNQEVYTVGLLVLQPAGIPLMNSPVITVAAWQLCRRLWCYIDVRNGTSYLCFSLQVATVLLGIMGSERYAAIRAAINPVISRTQDTLDLYGLVQLETPLRDLQLALKGTEAETAVWDMKCMLLTQFNWYPEKNSGKIMLLHPYNLHPERILEKYRKQSVYTDPYLFNMQPDFANELLDTGNPALDHLYGVIMEALRPETNADEVTETLEYMARQDESEQHMLAFLESSLMLAVTAEMRRLIHEAYETVWRWPATGGHRGN